MATGDLTALAWRVEEACLSAWPSPRQIIRDHWLMRFSGGATRRANSVNPLRGQDHDPSQIVATAEALYRAHGQPTLFRVPSIAHGMDDRLAELGYSREGDTATLHADLANFRPTWDGEVELTGKPTADWLHAKARISAQPESEQWVFEAMLSTIALPHAFAAARVGGQVAAVAYGVVDEGLLIVEAVATDEAHRRKGLARRTVGKLMDWACGQAAVGAALQVVSDNRPALGLYRSLGFDRELYRYHYRREPIRRGLQRPETVRQPFTARS